MREKRSCFVSSSGDPYTVLNLFSYYDNWKDEIDELWIGLNSTMPREVMTELIKKLPKGVNILYLNRQIGYGKPLELLLNLSPEGNVLLLEDDTIIFKKGVVDNYFTLLEKDDFDLIGSPRMSCTADTANRLADEFKLNYEGRGDKGPMFWPCFLWVKKSLLLKTDRNFDPSPWGDTFAWMSVQLRRLIKSEKILEIPQYHCSPDDDINKENKWGIFDGNCGYMHLGSLSSGIQSYLLTEDQIPLADLEAGIKAENPQPIPNTREMHNRIMWWWYCYKTNEGLSSDHLYRQAVKRSMVISGVTDDIINELEELYAGVIRGEND